MKCVFKVWFYFGWCVENGLERVKIEERGIFFGGRFGIIVNRLDVIYEEKREIKNDF